MFLLSVHGIIFFFVCGLPPPLHEKTLDGLYLLLILFLLAGADILCLSWRCLGLQRWTKTHRFICITLEYQHISQMSENLIKLCDTIMDKREEVKKLSRKKLFI